MSIPKDVVNDNLIQQPNIYLASNGYHRNLPDTSWVGNLVELVPKKIDAQINFDQLVNQVESNLDTLTENDYILIGNSSLVLMVALTHAFFIGVAVSLLEYDILYRTFRVYTLEENGATWTTTLLQNPRLSS